MSYPGLPKNPPSYENEFDYSVWTPSTIINMVNVPWDNSYRDVVRFDDDGARNAYFNSLSLASDAITIDRMVYLRYGEPVRVNCTFSAANRNNYLVVHNPVQPVPGHGGGRTPDTFYYFINDIRYVAPNTTELYIQLDVWMTYYDRISFGNCYIERGHIGIANENSTIENLSAYLTEPEGLEIGSEYDIVSQQWHGFQEDNSAVLIMSTADLTVDLGTIDKPNLETATGNIVDGLASGCNIYVCTGIEFVSIMKSLSVYPWASQCITCIMVMPYGFIREGDDVTIAGVHARLASSSHPSFTWESSFSNVFENLKIPTRYEQLLKFYTHPYSVLELTNLNGSPIIIKPETMLYQSDTLPLYMVGSFLMTGARFYLFPNNVNALSSRDNQFANYTTLSGDNVSTLLDGGEGLDCALVYDNFPQFSVVNNSYMFYMASTANTRAYQYQSADWTQQKALTSAELAFNQSSASTANMQTNANRNISAMWANNDISNQQAAVNGAMGAVNGLANAAGGNAAGGLMQTATSVANAALTVNWNNQRTGISADLTSDITANNARLANYNRDTNYDYAQFAAKGDYANTIAAIQAKVQDARLTQPSVSGQNGGQTANYACGLFGVLLKEKRLKMHFLNQVGEYWLRYGYSISRWITPPANLKCMTKVTYWKMQNCMLFAHIPEVHKNAIRGIFESGVSVWNNPTEINNIDLGTNRTIAGVSY